MISPTVKAAVALDHVSIQHKVDFRPVEARRFAARCESHGVENWRLRQMIREIDRFIPPMSFGLCNGKPNANNGKPHHWYTIGKEYSRVLYVHVAKLYLRDGFNYSGLGNFLKQLSEDYRADEFDIMEDSPLSFEARIWWD